MYAFQEGNYTQEGVKEESVKIKSTRIAPSIDDMAGKQESKVIKISMGSTLLFYSDN
jgi:hypothetical protein